MLDLTNNLLRTLPIGTPDLFNPWKDRCQRDVAGDAVKQRIERLRQHLNCAPRFILVGEAPGFQGCRYSGVAFTSESQLMNGKIPRIAAPNARLTDRHRAFSEPSATIVWRVLEDLNIQNETILWNAVQLHPHRPENPWSNRTPTRGEVALGVPALRLLRRAFPFAVFVPVGRKAEAILRDIDIPAMQYVRHPANRGAKQFAEGLRMIVGG